MHNTTLNNKESLKQLNCCVIVPTYNNQNTLPRVLGEVLNYCNDVIVVNDGSTDNTPQLLQQFNGRITVVNHAKNKGKGKALRNGFARAIAMGFNYAITIDSDGQHYPDDIPLIIEAAQKNPGAVIMGSRNMAQQGVPGKSSFGNKFSNFWFKLETGIALPDTQTGFRLYPLQPIKELKLFTTKFELEIEVIVKLAWRDVPFVAVPVKVKYDPAERVSHFKPFRDFTRISILNTWFVFLTILYHLPNRISKKLIKKGLLEAFRDELLKPDETLFVKALSVGFGVFMGIFPAWGFQMLIAFGLAMVFRLNKILVIVSSNVSIGPLIPLIVFCSYFVGGFFVDDKIIFAHVSDAGLTKINLNLKQYLIGSLIFASAAGFAGFLLTFILPRLIRRRAARVKV